MPEFPNSKYWAATENLDELADYLDEKIKDYGELLRSTKLYDRIARNWRYYHNQYFSDGESTGLDLKCLGEEGEYVGLSVNHHRNLLLHLLTLITQRRPVFEPLATNTDRKSLVQAKLAKSVLDHYLRKNRVEEHLKRACEHALVFGVGYILCTWDPARGREIDGDPMTGEVVKEGDLAFSNPIFEDVVYDTTIQDWRQELQWVEIGRMENIWDLVARHPDRMEDLLDEAGHDEEAGRPNWTRQERDTSEDQDRVKVWHFYHAKTDALPFGRYVRRVGSCVLEDSDLPYDGIPLYRVVPAEYVLTAHGYTPGFDLQGLAESFNMEVSNVLTNHKAYAVQNVWSPEPMEVEDLKGGLQHVKSPVKPEVLQLAQSAPETWQFIQLLEKQLEIISGVNSVARGQPEASLKSGTALALIDSKAMQFASGLEASYTMLLEDLGTAMVRILASRADTKRMISIVGKRNASRMAEFSGDDLVQIDRVIVQSGNALTRTISGRAQIADNLLEKGMIQTPEEYLTLLDTGQLEPMTESVVAQLDLIHRENEELMEGIRQVPLAIDNHVLHIREHAALLGSAEIRMDQRLGLMIFAHIMEHVEMLRHPVIQDLMRTLGYEAPLAPMLPGMGMGLPGMAPPGIGGGGPPRGVIEGPQGEAGGRPEGAARGARMPQPPRMPAGMAA